MKTMKAILAAAILIVVASCGCAEKQVAGDQNPVGIPDAENISHEADSGLQAANESLFLKDFSLVNDPYKNALFATGQGNRNESIRYYVNLTDSLAAFQEKYKEYRPSEINSDEQFSSDMMNVSSIVSGAKDDVYTGNLSLAHQKLEGVRPIFQGILIRNNLMSFSVALVDFHDAMELVLDAANNKDVARVMEAYPRADERLRAVESMSNESGIAAIRANLEAVADLAAENKTAELPAKAADLKASYVKVYLATD